MFHWTESVTQLLVVSGRAQYFGIRDWKTLANMTAHIAWNLTHGPEQQLTIDEFHLQPVSRPTSNVNKFRILAMLRGLQPQYTGQPVADIQLKKNLLHGVRKVFSQINGDITVDEASALDNTLNRILGLGHRTSLRKMAVIELNRLLNQIKNPSSPESDIDMLAEILTPDEEVTGASANKRMGWISSFLVGNIGAIDRRMTLPSTREKIAAMLGAAKWSTMDETLKNAERVKHPLGTLDAEIISVIGWAEMETLEKKDRERFLRMVSAIEQNRFEDILDNYADSKIQGIDLIDELVAEHGKPADVSNILREAVEAAVSSKRAGFQIIRRLCIWVSLWNLA